MINRHRLFGLTLDDFFSGTGYAVELEKDLRLALNQDQPIGNDRFYREIEAKTGLRRELRKRRRPRK